MASSHSDPAFPNIFTGGANGLEAGKEGWEDKITRRESVRLVRRAGSLLGNLWISGQGKPLDQRPGKTSGSPIPDGGYPTEGTSTEGISMGNISTASLGECRRCPGRFNPAQFPTLCQGRFPGNREGIMRCRRGSCAPPAPAPGVLREPADPWEF